MIDDTAARSQAREGCPARVEQASLTGAAARGPACRGDVLRAQRGGARGPLRSSAVVSWRHQTDRSTLLPGRRGSRLRSSGAILPAAGTPRGGGRAGKFQRLFLDFPRSCFQSGEAEKVRRGHVILAVKRSLRTPMGRRRTATPPQRSAPPSTAGCDHAEVLPGAGGQAGFHRKSNVRATRGQQPGSPEILSGSNEVGRFHEGFSAVGPASAPSWGEDDLAAPVTLPCPGGSSRRLLPCKPWATPHSMRTSLARPRRAVPGGTGGPHP